MTRKDWLTAIAIALAAVALRSVFLIGPILQDGDVRMQGMDSWYHLRFAMNLEANFPHAATHDPYLIASRTAEVPIAPGLAFLAASASLLIGGGATSMPNLGYVAAWIPPVLGGVAVLLVYLIARTLHDRHAAMTAALLLAIMHGQFFQRTSLGFFDQHVLEVLFLLAILASLLFAVREVGNEDDIRSPFRGRLFALTSGCLSTVLYCLSWRSAIMGIAMIAVAAVVSLFVRQRIAGRATGALALMLAGAAIVIIPFKGFSPSAERQAVVLAILVIMLAVATILSRLLASGRIARGLTAVLAALAFTTLGYVAWIAARNQVQLLLNDARRLVLDSSPMFVAEATPLYSFDTPLQFLWSDSTVTWLVALVVIPLLFRHAFRERSVGDVIALTWTVTAIASMVLQIRFAYYAAPGFALVTGLAFARYRLTRTRMANVAMLWLVAANVVVASRTAGEYFALPNTHRSLFASLAEVSPEPFADAEKFLARYGEKEPLPSYAVAAWWDQGYWISAIARRVPIANPTQEGVNETARLFLATDEESSDVIADAVRARYFVVGEDLAFLPPEAVAGPTAGAFPGLVSWGDESLERFYELVDYHEQGQEPRQIYVFYPAYFRTLAVRLYLHQGHAVTNPEYFVGTFETDTTASGKATRRLVSIERKSNYVDAMNAELQSGDVDRRLLSLDPLKTCIPLEAMQGYRLIGQTDDSTTRGTGRPSLMLFERVAR